MRGENLTLFQMLALLWTPTVGALCALGLSGCVGTPKATAPIPPATPELTGKILEPCVGAAFPEGDPPTESARGAFEVAQQAALNVCEKKRAGAVAVAQAAIARPAEPKGFARLRGFLPF